MQGESSAKEIDKINNADGQKNHKKAVQGLIKEIFRFIIILIILGGGTIFIIFIIDWLTPGDSFDLLFYILWYPMATLSTVIWIKKIERRNLKEYLGSKLKWPERGSRWFYILYGVFFSCCIAVWVILLISGPQYADIQYTSLPVFILRLTHSCVGAPLVEEYLFRGYIYERSKTVWGTDGLYISINKQITSHNDLKQKKKELSLMRITYAGLFSSLLFGIWHLNIIQTIYTFFGGLIFVKTKREWGQSLVAPIMLHSSWNLMAQIVVFTELPWLVGLIDDLIALI